MTSLLFCLALLVLPAPSPAGSAGDLALLPPDGFNGWKKVDAPKRFTQADLYGYIDGGAELFLEFGFDELTVQKYRNGPDEFTVEAYRMTDAPAATGVYLMKAGRETPLGSFKERHTANRYQLMFCRNRYFVIVNNLGGREALAPGEAQFAAFVAGKLAATPAIPEMQALPAQGLVAGSTRLVRGAYGLQAVFTLGDGDILQLGRRLTAVAGDYKTATGTHTLIVANYPDAAQARRAFEYVLKNLDKYLKVVEQKRDRFVFQDYSKKFGVIALAGTTLQVTVKLAQKP